MTKIYHDSVRGRAVIGPYEVEFDENGHCLLEDDDYAKQLCNDGIGFSEILPLPEETVEAEIEVPRVPKRKSADK